MSYSITVSGHKMFDTPEEAKQFEEGVQAKAQQLVAGLEGVNAAQMMGQHTGTTNLMPQTAQATEPTTTTTGA